MSSFKASKDRGLAKLMASTLTVAMLAKGIALIMAILLARALGPEAFGVFVFAQGAGQIAGLISTLGWPTLTTRQVSIFLQTDQISKLKGLLKAGSLITWGASTFVGLLLCIGAGIVNASGTNETMARGLLLAGALCPTIAARQLYRQRLAALKMPAIAVCLDEVLPPLAVVLIVFLPDLSALKANLAYAFASLIGIFIAALIFNRKLAPTLTDAPPSYDMNPWIKSGLFLIAAASAKLLMNKTDIVMLAPLAGFEQTGLYGTAFRLTYAITFPQVALSLVMSPRLAAAFNSGDMRRLKQVLKKAYIYTLTTTLITVLPIVIAPEYILSHIFGAEYTGAAPVLVVLALSQSLAAFGVILAALASMTSKERILAATTWFALALNLGLNFLWIPSFGALGAAYASLVSGALLVGSNVYFVLWTVLKTPHNKEADHD